MEQKNKDKINFKYNLKTYSGFLFKYKYLVFFLVLLTIFTESKTVFDRYLFKLIIDNGTKFTSSQLMKSEFINILLIIA